MSLLGHKRRAFKGEIIDKLLATLKAQEPLKSSGYATTTIARYMAYLRTEGLVEFAPREHRYRLTQAGKKHVKRESECASFRA